MVEMMLFWPRDMFYPSHRFGSSGDGSHLGGLFFTWFIDEYPKQGEMSWC